MSGTVSDRDAVDQTNRSGMQLATMLMHVFPNGTNAPSDGGTLPHNDIGPWETIPALAADLFGFCGYLVQITGMMGYFDPNPKAETEFSRDKILNIVIDDPQRDAIKKASQKWRTNGIPDDYTRGLWAVIIAAERSIIRLKPYQSYHQRHSKSRTAAPPWWRAVITLLVIADEACDGIGHQHWPGHENSNSILPDFKSLQQRVMASREKEKTADTIPLGSDNTLRIHKAARQVSSLTWAANKEIVCVQPKGRVTGVGCATRNLSRNLSLTGPVGGVRCSWHPALRKPKVGKRQSLNLLLIPTPLEIKAKWFETSDQATTAKWGQFELKQQWLVPQEEFIYRIHQIVKTAAEDVGQIHGIVFPEYALTFEVFAKILTGSFEASGQTLEFVVAGAKGNCDQEADNHVLIATWEDDSGDTAGDRSKYFRLVSQKKHHRWKLDRDQISTYGLGASLSPSLEWWEKHSIDTREINFFQIREDAVFTSLICEDLARNDPCHDIVRSVAPNLVFALLMDGPQLPNRWSARYAGSLADDPGCTVLTLTSFGLIDRSNDHRSRDKSHSVGLLRDSKGSTTEIMLPTDNDAVLLTLGSEEANDYTIDGRSTTNASKWFYVSQRPIKLPAKKPDRSRKRKPKPAPT